MSTAPVTVTPRLDPEPIRRGFARLAAHLAALQPASAGLARAALRLRLHADPEYRTVYVAGREARAYVAAGFDPALATEDALQAYLDQILRDDVMSAEDRAYVAARAAEAWIRHRPAPAESGPRAVAWHRWIGGRAVVVTRG